MEALTDQRIPVRALLLVVAASCALLLTLPGQTVTTRYLNDLLLILDGAYRVTWGEVPSRDFHTPLGPLAYYLPAVGYGLSGNFGGALPAAMALTTLVLLLPMLHVFGSRLHSVIALLFGAFLLLILAAPINLGEGITSLSFAKFYNRIGWVALGILLIMHLHPRRESARQGFLDCLCAAGLTLIMLYTKFTYGIVALSFLILTLTDREQRRWSLGSLGLIVIACAAIEAVWQSSLVYLSDLRIALEVGGRLRGTWGQIADHILGNLTDYVLLALFAGLALKRRPSLRDTAFYFFCAITGFLIINQNFQAWGIVALHAASAVAAEKWLRAEAEAASTHVGRMSSGAGIQLLFLALVLPTIVHCTASLGLHMISASMRAGQPLPFNGLERVRLANLWTWGEYETANLYLAGLREGAELLSEADVTGLRIAALDLANPFPMFLNAPPPKGDLPWLQWGRTLNASAFIPAQLLLAQAEVVMEPKSAGDQAQADSALIGLKGLYGSYVDEHFEVVRETSHWRMHRRRDLPEPKAMSRNTEPS